MDPRIFSLVNEEKVGRQVIGAIGYRHEGGKFHGSLLHDFELLILVICKGLNEGTVTIEHCMNEDMHYQLLYIGRDDLRRWVVAGDNREIVQCFIHGEVIWDVEGELASLHTEITAFGEDMREQRKFKEFTKFLQMYLEAKRFAKEQDLMDAYYSVIQALKHYARIELIEQGFLPESSVWEQMRPLNSVVYKLFDELTDGKETLGQRIELVLLASDFFVVSKMTECCSPLLRILASRKETWSIQELVQLPQLYHVRDELPMVLRNLVYRSLVKESVKGPLEGLGEGREIRYWT